MSTTRKERLKNKEEGVRTLMGIPSPQKELTRPGTRLFLHAHAFLTFLSALFWPFLPLPTIHLFLGVMLHPTLFGKAQHVITAVLLIAMQNAFLL